MKTIILLFAILFGMLLGIFLLQNPANRVSIFSKTPKETIGNHSFNVKVAKTPKEKEIGLSETKSLSDDEGMVFPFDHSDYYAFWMKNMDFPIDIIYIQNGKVVDIFPSVNPPTDSSNPPVYQPKSPADTVLEIKAGLSSKYGFKIGDDAKSSNLD